jgi:Domain of unknown function (DUF4375)
VRPRRTDFRIPRSSLSEPSDPAQVVWDVIEPMWEELDTPYEPDERLESAATAGQRAPYALHWTSAEVCNGGFHQFFTNPTGMLTREAIAGAYLIGASEYGKAIERAASVFEGDVPLIQDERRSRLAHLTTEESQRLTAADERWYDLLRDPTTALESYAGKYVGEHPDDFFVQSRALPRGS